MQASAYIRKYFNQDADTLFPPPDKVSADLQALKADFEVVASQVEECLFHTRLQDKVTNRVDLEQRLAQLQSRIALLQNSVQEIEQSRELAYLEERRAELLKNLQAAIDTGYLEACGTLHTILTEGQAILQKKLKDTETEQQLNALAALTQKPNSPNLSIYREAYKILRGVARCYQGTKAVDSALTLTTPTVPSVLTLQGQDVTIFAERRDTLLTPSSGSEAGENLTSTTKRIQEVLEKRIGQIYKGEREPDFGLSCVQVENFLYSYVLKQLRSDLQAAHAQLIQKDLSPETIKKFHYLGAVGELFNRLAARLAHYEKLIREPYATFWSVDGDVARYSQNFAVLSFSLPTYALDAIDGLFTIFQKVASLRVPDHLAPHTKTIERSLARLGVRAIQEQQKLFEHIAETTRKGKLIEDSPAAFTYAKQCLFVWLHQSYEPFSFEFEVISNAFETESQHKALFGRYCDLLKGVGVPRQFIEKHARFARLALSYQAQEQVDPRAALTVAHYMFWQNELKKAKAPYEPLKEVDRLMQELQKKCTLPDLISYDEFSKGHHTLILKFLSDYKELVLAQLYTTLVYALHGSDPAKQEAVQSLISFFTSLPKLRNTWSDYQELAPFKPLVAEIVRQNLTSKNRDLTKFEKEASGSP